MTLGILLSTLAFAEPPDLCAGLSDRECVRALRSAEPGPDRRRSAIDACLRGVVHACGIAGDEVLVGAREHPERVEWARHLYRQGCSDDMMVICEVPTFVFVALGDLQRAANYASMGCSRGKESYCALSIIYRAEDGDPQISDDDLAEALALFEAYRLDPYAGRMNDRRVDRVLEYIDRPSDADGP